MMRRIVFAAVAFLFALYGFRPTPCSAAGLPSAGTDVKFSVSTPTEIPGGTLAPGSHTIRVVDHLSDRVVLAIDGNGSGSSQEMFLAVPASKVVSARPAGPVTFTGAQGSAALRGFVFPDGESVEFVYPKGEAVALAKSNAAPVIAIDPASEGRPELNDLTPEDRKLITLWMLSPAQVTAENSAGISATKYHAQRSGKPALVAESRPPVAKLPKTSSELPLVVLLGFFASLMGVVLTSRRLLLATH